MAGKKPMTPAIEKQIIEEVVDTIYHDPDIITPKEFEPAVQSIDSLRDAILFFKGEREKGERALGRIIINKKAYTHEGDDRYMLQIGFDSASNDDRPEFMAPVGTKFAEVNFTKTYDPKEIWDDEDAECVNNDEVIDEMITRIFIDVRNFLREC